MSNTSSTALTAESAQLGQVADTSRDDERIVIYGVLNRLGRPKNLVRTVAKRVGEKTYRVNVYCADDADRPVSAVTITDSFFVTLNGQEILSMPTITRKYQ